MPLMPEMLDFSLDSLGEGAERGICSVGLERILDVEQRAGNSLIHWLIHVPCLSSRRFLMRKRCWDNSNLICANSVSVIIHDDVAAEGDSDYLDDLYRTLRQSNQFQLVTATLLSMPARFAAKLSAISSWCARFSFPIAFATTRKRARIMSNIGQATLRQR